MPMKNPPHPRDFIWTAIIEPAGLKERALQAEMGVEKLFSCCTCHKAIHG